MKNVIKKYPVIVSLIMVCTIFAVITSFYSGMYDLFEYRSNPTHFWQYISGAFMHGDRTAPIWYIWVHLFLNCLMLIPFGGFLERISGSRNTLLICISALILSSAVAQVLLYGTGLPACGVSAIGYAFVVGALVNMKNEWKTLSKKGQTTYVLLSVIALVMLLPMITGWISTCLHLSGIFGYFVAAFIIHRKRR